MDDQKSEKFDRNNYKLQRREYDQNLQVAKTRIRLKHSKGTITAIIEYDQKTTSVAQRIKIRSYKVHPAYRTLEFVEKKLDEF